MKNLKYVISSLIGVFTLLLAMTSFAHGHHKHVKLMFIQTGHNALLSPTGKNQFQFTVYNVDNYVSYFSDRPHRISGLIPASEFAQLWDAHSKKSFLGNPPNVAIETIEDNAGKSKHVEILAVLSKPQYDKIMHSMTYILKPLKANTIALKKMRFGFTVIFFDNLSYPWNPNNT